MGNSESVNLAQLETQRYKLKEENETAREKIKLDADTVKKDNEKEKITKERLVELANLDLKKSDMLKKFEVEILSRNHEHEKHTHKNKLEALFKMMDKEYDEVAINCLLTGITRSFGNDKSITDGEFLDTLVRVKLAAQGKAITASTDPDQPENQDQDQ